MSRASWLETHVRPLVVGAMIGCIALSIVELIRPFVSGWNGPFFFVACVLVAWEAHYSYRIVEAKSLYLTDAWKFRAIELLTLLILLKIGSFLGDPWADVVADIRAWPDQPSRIIDLEMGLASVLVFLSWFASTETARDLERLDEASGLHREARPPLESLASRFFWGGTLLLIVSGLARVGLAELLDLRRPSVSGLVVNALVYFVLGLVMLGQGRFVLLRKVWREQDMEVAGDLAGRWARYSLVLIGLAAAIAFLLPTGYTMGLLDLLAAMVALVSEIASLVAIFLMFLFSIPFWLLARLFFREKEPVARPTLPAAALPRYGEAATRVPLGWDTLRSLLFWIVLVGVVAYVLRGYLYDHPELLEALRRFAPFRALCSLWFALRRGLGRWAVGNRERWPRRSAVEKRRKATVSRVRRLWPGARSLRERIFRYYWSILRRAKETGIPRQPSQTPYEYGETLGPGLVEAREEMDFVTAAFVEARYSQRPVEPEQVDRVRAAWQRVMEALKTRTASGNVDRAERP
ncbi:MAG: DUF4129 domain-containing protein [Anaerolineae bacterium]|nr:DUF4129 domain-containing protein [Anaerolineae bacterium]